MHEDGALLAGECHQIEKSHASLLPGIANEVVKKAGKRLKDLAAVAVSSGPGSYTGLRIGVTNAKGLCYGLDIPLISVGTLDVLSAAVRDRLKGEFFLCPMLDARRMEVYTKLVDQDDQVIWETQPKILDASSLSDIDGITYVFGDGMPKFREVATSDQLVFIADIFPDASNMGELAFRKFQNSAFEDIAYFEPNYLKEWRTTSPTNRL